MQDHTESVRLHRHSQIWPPDFDDSLRRPFQSILAWRSVDQATAASLDIYGGSMTPWGYPKVVGL